MHQWPSLALEPRQSSSRHSWNINYAAPHAKERLICILTYLANAVFRSQWSSPDPCCILFQEVAAHVFHTLISHDWVRRHFLVVPSSPDKWPRGATYGNVTLISNSVPFISAQSLVFGNSTMGRNALVAEIALRDPTSARALILRVANTHLESMPSGASARVWQLWAVADKLIKPGVCGGIVAGDMNAMYPSDETMHTYAGLVDAYRGRTDSRESHTWGYQPPTRYPPARVDRVYYSSGSAVPDGPSLQVDEPQQVGVALRTPRGQWASDHHGLITTMHFAWRSPGIGRYHSPRSLHAGGW